MTYLLQTHLNVCAVQLIFVFDPLILVICPAAVRLVMTQAHLDLAYFKCGHCQKLFNSLAAFGKHQKEIHTPKNAPKMLEPKEEPRPVQEPVKEEEEEEKQLQAHFEFELKLKLCQKCASSVKVYRQKKLQVNLCSRCLLRNAIFETENWI
jgi:hypothetical protein